MAHGCIRCMTCGNHCPMCSPCRLEVMGENYVGWAYTKTSTKAHYFPSDRSGSLCFGWRTYRGPFRYVPDLASHERCQTCRERTAE